MSQLPNQPYRAGQSNQGNQRPEPTLSEIGAVLSQNIKRTEELANFINSIGININDIFIPRIKTMDEELMYSQFSLDFLLNKVAELKGVSFEEVQIELLQAFQGAPIPTDKPEESCPQLPTNKSDEN